MRRTNSTGSATSGHVVVSNNGVPSNSVPFTVSGQLSVTGVSPSLGSVGSSVTITGAGFGATQSTSTANFNGATATVTSWSNTTIVATVPLGASTGPVGVTVQVATVPAYGPSFEVSSTVQLTESFGHQSSYTAIMAGGKWYVSDAQGSGCSSCTVRGVVHNTYDNNGNVLSTTDELGRTTSYTYDGNSNVMSTTQPSVSGGTPTDLMEFLYHGV